MSIEEAITYIADYCDSHYFNLNGKPCEGCRLNINGDGDCIVGYNISHWKGLVEATADRKDEPQTSGTPYKIEVSSICKTEL